MSPMWSRSKTDSFFAPAYAGLAEATRLVRGSSGLTWRASLEHACGGREGHRIFNAAPWHLDEVYGGHSHGMFFRTLGDHGFHDCHWAQHGQEVQSFGA